MEEIEQSKPIHLILKNKAMPAAKKKSATKKKSTAKKTTKRKLNPAMVKGMAKAKAIHKANPKKKWTTCVKEGFKK
jgi:hypothetical protein